MVVENLPPQLKVAVAVLLMVSYLGTPGLVKTDQPWLGGSCNQLLNCHLLDCGPTDKMYDLDLTSVVSKSR